MAKQSKKEKTNKLQKPEKQNSSHDEFFKSTFGLAPIAKQYLENYLSLDEVALLDTSALVLDPNSYVSGQLRESMSDVVWSCPLRESSITVKVSFLFEHKSSPEPYPHLQLLEYMLGMYHAAVKASEQLPLVLPIVVYHGQSEWNYRPFSDYYTQLPATFKRYLPQFDYQLTDLGRFNLEEMRTKGSGGLFNVFLALLRAREAAFVRDNFHLLVVGIAPELTENLYHSIFVYTFKNSEFSQQAIRKILANAESKIQDPNIMSTYDILIQTSRQEGRQEGREEGINLGIEKGIRVLLRTTDMGLQEIADELECGLDLVIKVNDELKAR